MWQYFLMPFLSSLFGAGNALFGNSLAQQRESQARADNYKYGEMAAENADKRTRALYNDLQSPQAIIQQLQDAELSPSLMYSGGGIGGNTPAGAQGGGANGISPNMYTLDAMQLAELQKVQAETKLINEEAETEAGTNERGASEIDNIIAQTGNYNAMTNYAESQNELIKLTQESTISEAKSNAAIAANKAEQSFNEMKQSGIEFEVSEATKNARIDKQKESVNLIISQRLKNYKDMKLTDAQIKEISASISMMYDTSMREWAITDATLQNADTFAKEINQKQKQFEQQLDLELDKWGFDKDHWFKNKLVDLSGDLIHAGGYIIGLSMMKGGKNAGKLQLSQKKGEFNYGKFDPKFNGKAGGIEYKNGLPVIPKVYF